MEGIFEKKDLKIKIIKVKGFEGFEPMFHSHLEIIYILSGNINVTIDGIQKNLSQGEMCITFPYVTHSYETSNNAEAIILLFDPSVTDYFEKKILFYKPTNPYIAEASAFLPLLNKIMHHSSQISAEHLKMANIYLFALLGEILFSVELVPIDGIAVNTIRKILIYCSEHYTEDITAKSVSQNLYISQSTITKIFAKKLGCSFRDYINNLRINKAKYYLENTNKKIIEIMYECGFKNQSSFNRLYMEITGTTPSECRKNIKNI